MGFPKCCRTMGLRMQENYKIEDLRYFTEFNVDLK